MYQPKIRNENIRKLYKLRVQKKKPMTRVLDEILNDYFDSLSKNANNEEIRSSEKPF